MKKNNLIVLLLLIIPLSCIKYPVPQYQQKTPQKQEEPQGKDDEDEKPKPVAIDTVEFNVENSSARNYMDYVYAHPYTVSDFSVTYIENYYKVPAKHVGDRPAEAIIHWTSVDGAKSYSVTVSEKEDLSSPVRKESLSSSAFSYTFTNLIPGHSYHCSVASVDGNGESTEVARTFIKATGRRRMISAPSIGNVRDLGGLCTEDGKHTKYGLIFRGSRLNNNGMVLTQEDKEELLRVGIKADLDLRENTEEKLGDVYRTRKSPISNDIDFKLFPTANKSYFKKLRENDEYIKAVQWIIDELRAGKPVYFHCKTGADRTGTLAFLIESLLGVTETDKSIDFELTSFFFDFGDPQIYAFRSRNIDKTIEIADKSSYDWGGMYDVIDSHYSGDTYSRKVYNYLNKGIGTSSSATVSSDDLDWFINYMLE